MDKWNINPTDQTYNLTRGNRVVEWWNCNEGWSGDYNPEDPDDTNLLRFDVMELDGNGNREHLDDASYCTRMPADTPEKNLRRAAETIMNETYGRSNIKKICERLSWISPDDLKED